MTTPRERAHDDEADLVEIVQRGFRYALALTKDRHVAEDLVHEALVAMLRKSAVRSAPYLFTIVRNRFADKLRRDDQIRMERIDDVDEARIGASIDAEVECWEPAALERALGRLRPEEREVLVLACVEDLTCAQIAEIFGRPRGTVTSLLHRAQEKLRQYVLRGSSEASP